MTNSKPTVDSEFAAIQTLYMTLEPLDTDARSRIVNYVVDRLEIVLQSMPESESIHSVCDTSSEKLIHKQRSCSQRHLVPLPSCSMRPNRS